MRKFQSASLAVLIGLGAAMSLVAPGISQAQVSIGISVGYGPPAIPYYRQPEIPGYGYIWTPGYWAYDDDYSDYYWVPGTWVRPPRIGYLWTPGYWGYNDGSYLFNQGYWGSSIGFYGGINYGYGYGGYGYDGGYWRGRDFYYNRTVNNVTNINITNVYNRQVNTTINHISYNGGPTGVQARPTPQQLAVTNRPRLQPTALQMQHRQMAATTPALRASINHGAPAIAATAQPGVLRGPGVIAAARPGAPYHPGNSFARPNQSQPRQAQQPMTNPQGDRVSQSQRGPYHANARVNPDSGYGGNPNYYGQAHQNPRQSVPRDQAGQLRDRSYPQQQGHAPPQQQLRGPPQQQFHGPPQQQFRAPSQQQFRGPPPGQSHAPPPQRERAQPQSRQAPEDRRDGGRQ